MRSIARKAASRPQPAPLCCADHITMPLPPPPRPHTHFTLVLTPPPPPRPAAELMAASEASGAPPAVWVGACAVDAATGQVLLGQWLDDELRSQVGGDCCDVGCLTAQEGTR
jgi:DNA mismatch repair protein MSH6